MAGSLSIWLLLAVVAVVQMMAPVLAVAVAVAAYLLI
jgi:hypothetical protein